MVEMEFTGQRGRVWPAEVTQMSSMSINVRRDKVMNDYC